MRCPGKLRTAVNWLGLATPLGLAVAAVGRCAVQRRGHGIWLATGYHYRFPVANAFTIGSVVVTAHPREWLITHPALLRHEERHAGQWAACGGLPFLPLYVAVMGWSWVRTRDRASGNWFERAAGLRDGGYLDRRTPHASHRHLSPPDPPRVVGSRVQCSVPSPVRPAARRRPLAR